MILAALLWSTGGVFIKAVDLSPFAISGVRSLFALVTLLVLVGRPRRPTFGAGSHALWLGALFYTLTLFCFVTATKLTTAANAILLQYTAPVYVALMSGFFLGEPIRRSDWTAVIIVMIGMTMFFGDRLDAGGLAGNLLGLISGVFLASMVVSLRSQKDQSTHDSIIWGNVLVAIIGTPFLVQGIPSGKGVAALAFLGVFQIGCAYYFYGKAIKKVPALESILIPTLEPLLNPVWVWMFIGERPGPWALTGGVIILVTLPVHGLTSAPRKPSEPMVTAEPSSLTTG
ncbi:MAG TPA: DMT family transporter [Candidatus Ozemobacteraceae bacterium]|nr:DMT family transporter [Candidatus Ozemobacteraceae bacterium]